MKQEVNDGNTQKMSPCESDLYTSCFRSGKARNNTFLFCGAGIINARTESGYHGFRRPRGRVKGDFSALD
ncbi:hypothetical protein NQZ68_017197 [Dissostichus eleginoides]|nr:hypothetical protein NQZ68_017197 [Dissostichus eleginoides]